MGLLSIMAVEERLRGPFLSSYFRDHILSTSKEKFQVFIYLYLAYPFNAIIFVCYYFPPYFHLSQKRKQIILPGMRIGESFVPRDK